MFKKNVLSISIIISSLIIGLSFVIVQVNKQNSIERQKEMEINYKKEVQKEKDMKENERKNELRNCLNNSEKLYWSYMELNGKKNKDGSIEASQYRWDVADKEREKRNETCFKLWK